MDKKDTQKLKGVAIIMMLLYHLFYVKQGGEYVAFFSLGECSFIKRFSEICYPVSLYVMLSGYGLYASYSGRPSHWGKSIFKRITNLYVHLWGVYLVILPIACCIYPGKYPGDIQTFFKNFFSISCSYNAEQWFLFPYILLLCLAKPIFICVERVKPIIFFILVLAIQLVYLITVKYIGLQVIRDYLSGAINLFFVLGFILPFALGVAAKKYLWVESVSKCFGTVKYLPCLILIVIGIIRMFLPSQSLQPFVMLALVLFFPIIDIPKWVNRILSYMGKHSTNLWLIHTWLCYYLFKDFIYSFRFPILIFLVTAILSLLISRIVDMISNCLNECMIKGNNAS